MIFQTFLRPIRVFHLDAPHRLAFDELASQGGPFEGHSVGSEWVAVSKIGNRAEEGALDGAEKGHRREYTSSV